MFDTLQNAVNIHFTLVPDGPILVRAQNSSLDPGIADSEFQRTWKDGQRTTFLAGSGLKGVLRSHCERLLRTNSRFACDPTIGPNRKARVQHPLERCNPKTGHGQRNRDPKRPHSGLCAACFIFGSTSLAGRFRFADAYPVQQLWEETNLTETRTGVGIDRRSQGASSGVLYDTEVVVSGGFGVRLMGENFSLWQLGLVLQALEDLDAGFVQIGGCKSRGMGTVKIEDWKIGWRFLDRQSGSLNGAGRNSQEIRKYGLPDRDRLQIADIRGISESRMGLFRIVNFEGETIHDVAKRLATGPLSDYFRGGVQRHG